MSHTLLDTAKSKTTMQYGHWGITVSTRADARDYSPATFKQFPYPVGARGPIDSAETEREAIAFCRSLGGEVKGPFFRQPSAK